MFEKTFRGRPGQSGRGKGRHGQGSGRGNGSGRGYGGGTKAGSSPGGYCVCPNCGKRVAHVAGQRCIDQICPDCGAKMTRE